ncbi:MAG: DNA polymerase I [Pseudomonadota bacterium]|nr:DNA polymerase I [Pseudomonadota bacterium]
MMVEANRLAEGKTIYLVDGSAYIFRAFHALPPMSRADGTPVNAVYGFTNMLTKLVEDTNAEFLAVIFDTARKTFRSEIYPEYKANRPPPPEELIPQFDLIREATRAHNIPCVEKGGFEADDLIATYARVAVENGLEVTIVSSDKDLMQLVGPKVRMMDPMKNRFIGPTEVYEKFGVGPEKVIEVQALAGDPTDNVPGVPGIGVKTAAQLLNEYGDLETLLERANEIKQPKRRESLIDNSGLARISRDLVSLRDDVPLDQDILDFRISSPDPEVLIPFLEEQGFKTALARAYSQFGLNAEVSTTQIDAESDGPNFELVEREEVLVVWLEKIADGGVVAFDTETTSLDSIQAELVGLSLSIKTGHACYIPLAHVSPANANKGELLLSDVDRLPVSPPNQIPFDRAIELLKPMLEDPGILKVGHNIKYDMQIMAHYGVSVAPVDDTMLLSYVLEGGAHGHGLDELAKLHFGHDNIKYSDVTGTGRNKIPFSEVSLDKALDYAAEDADMTGRLYRLLKPRIATEKMSSVYETLERALIPVLSQMEWTGIIVDAPFLKNLSVDLERRTVDIADEVYLLAGREFNIGSPKQLGEVLFDEMGIEGGKKTKTGAYGTGAEILEGLANQGHELPRRVLDWRQLSKLRSTYTEALVRQINPKTNRVHTSYAQAIASTGRLSSTDPNLQNIPIRTEEGRKIRQAFVPQRGHVLLSADYSQIELRLLAHVARIDALKGAFRKNLDIHSMTASEVFGLPLDAMQPSERNRAKAINFGIIYGISPFGLARQLAITQTEAKKYIESYFQKFPGIQEYMEQTKIFARANGFVRTIFGRKCHTPGINDKNPARRNFSERAAINAPLQGAAADIIKRAMIILPDALKNAGLHAKMLLQVHDELIFEVPDEEIEDTARTVRATMESAAELDVPLVVEVGIGKNWDEAH